MLELNFDDSSMNTAEALNPWADFDVTQDYDLELYLNNSDLDNN